MLVPFVECVTVRNWCGAIFPRLLWRRLRGEPFASHGYMIEGSRLAMWVARLSGWLMEMRMERLDFRLVEARDEQGIWLWLRIAYQDLALVQAEAMNDPIFEPLASSQDDTGRLRTYLEKALASVDLINGTALSSTLLVIQICDWVIRHRGSQGASPLLFVRRRPWQQAIARYAAQFGVTVVHVPEPFRGRDWLRGHLSPELKALVRQMRTRWHAARLRPSVAVAPRHPDPAPSARVSVEYYGHLNLKQPERHSDLFFWQQSALPGRAIVMTFNLAVDPLTETMWEALNAHGIQSVAMDPRATTAAQASVFSQTLRKRATPSSGLGAGSGSPRAEARWLRDRIAAYHELRAYWTEFFSTYGIKVYLTWFKYNEQHCAVADALQQLGGITAIYQRAYEDQPTAEASINADLVFGFSPATAKVERQAHSVIPYHVTVGYPGDHRFSLWREHAARIRQELHAQGARRILAFTDETSFDNPRLYLDNQSQQENYQFLLEKLLREPWLGLIFKPKSPATLRRRLGPVADVLKQAEATGRCYVFRGGRLQSSDPPAAAALAADVAIHGHLFGGTAGLETALAGVPTLLLDREGWPRSALYRLGVERVIFTEWDGLWKACVEHWTQTNGVPGFGDWSPMLDELDPFRDGRAAERIGTYVQWLLEGFESGLSRETVMADAAERYGALWGRQYIAHVNAEPAMPFRAAAPVDA